MRLSLVTPLWWTCSNPGDGTGRPGGGPYEGSSISMDVGAAKLADMIAGSSNV